MNVIVLGSTKGGGRTQFEGSMQRARRFIKANNLARWAIYRPYVNGRPFHNATDPDYLIEHNDPYWRNVESKGE